ncbi:MAG: hypothetical protein RIC36_20220 [Rhodospirillales bacterium]
MKTIWRPGSAEGNSTGWLAAILFLTTVLILPRFIFGPFSVVGVLGDIGDYSVPYFMAAASDIRGFGDGFLSSVPMGGRLYEIGINAPLQLLLYTVLPGWLANGLNWLFLSLAAATSLYLLAVRHFDLPQRSAALAAVIGAAAVINGNFGYAVVALVPVVLLQALAFVRRPDLLSGLLLCAAAMLFGLWVPAKFLVIFPAIVLTLSILTLGDGRFRWRMLACVLVVVSIYTFRAGDIGDYLMATAASDRDWIVERQSTGSLLMLGAEYVFEYMDPRVLFELRPLPQTNPTSIAFWLIILAVLSRTVTGKFVRLLYLILGLAVLQIVFPVIWQWVAFDLLDLPGLYFHPKLWRPVMPLLYLAGGCAAAGLATRFRPLVTARVSPGTSRRLLHAPLVILLLVVALQSYGFAARSWLVDGSFRALYQDQAIAGIARKLVDMPLPPRSVILDKPNGTLAAYGLRTPLGRSEWIPHRYAVLMRAAGLLLDPGRGGIGYQSSSNAATMVQYEDLQSDARGQVLRNFLALTSVEWVFSRGQLPDDLFAREAAPGWNDWSSYDLWQRIEHSMISGLTGRTALAAFHFEQALPTIYPVTSYVVAETSEQAARQILAHPVNDLNNFAIIERDSALAASPVALSKVVIHQISNRPDGIVMQVQSSGQGLLIVTELIDQGWHYLIDGSPAEVIAANAAFVGLPVPPGEHELVLRRTLMD